VHSESYCAGKRGSDFAGCQAARVNRTAAEHRPGNYYPSIKTAVLKDGQFVTDADGRRVGVLLDLRAYERLREAQEELADIQAYDAAVPRVQAEIASGQFVSLSAYRAKRAGKQK
jgi:hypothetical protein